MLARKKYKQKKNVLKQAEINLTNYFSQSAEGTQAEIKTNSEG